MEDKFEGQQISAFVKNTDKIWEGILIVRDDGTQIVLNETTKNWKKLSDLEHIRLIEEENLADKIKTASDSWAGLLSTTFGDVDKIDPSKIKPNSVQKATKDLTDKAEATGLDTPKTPEEREKSVIDHLSNAYIKGEETKSAGDQQKNVEAEENINQFKKEIGMKIGESLKLLHPLLRESEDTHYEMDDEDLEETNEETGNIPAEEIRQFAVEILSDDQVDLRDAIADKFDLDDEAAEKYAIQAMEEYLSSIDDEIEEDEDEIEKDFEETIDEYDGDTDGLLDYLVDTYEIDPEEAEFIYEEKRGNLTECIYAFVDVVKKRLTEDIVRFIKDNENLSPEDKEEINNKAGKYPERSKKINWQSKEIKGWTKDQFLDILDQKTASQEKREIKQEIKSGDLEAAFKNTTIKTWYKDDNIILASPTTHADCVYLNSYNCFGTGAKWCIGTEDNSAYWNDYVFDEGKIFIFIYIKNINKKLMTCSEWNGRKFNIDFFDEKDDEFNASSFSDVFNQINDPESGVQIDSSEEKEEYNYYDDLDYDSWGLTKEEIEIKEQKSFPFQKIKPLPSNLLDSILKSAYKLFKELPNEVLIKAENDVKDAVNNAFNNKDSVTIDDFETKVNDIKCGDGLDYEDWDKIFIKYKDQIINYYHYRFINYPSDYEKMSSGLLWNDVLHEILNINEKNLRAFYKNILIEIKKKLNMNFYTNNKMRIAAVQLFINLFSLHKYGIDDASRAHERLQSDYEEKVRLAIKKRGSRSPKIRAEVKASIPLPIDIKAAALKFLRAPIKESRIEEYLDKVVLREGDLFIHKALKNSPLHQAASATLSGPGQLGSAIFDRQYGKQKPVQTGPKFTKGRLVRNDKFGEGIIEDFLGNGKYSVHFYGPKKTKTMKEGDLK